MTGFSARRLGSACAVTAVSALAFMLPGAATASAACPGAQIKGDGSTLQEVAQHEDFIPAFNAKCEGGEVAEYHPNGSGAGLESWGNNGHAAEFSTYEYAGTDQPPNPTQKATIEAAAGGAKLLSIPTVQAAEAIVVHLPKGCTSAKSKYSTSKGRLVLNNATLEGIFKRSITKWSELKDDGDELLPAGCEGSTPITRDVREDGSGTTAIFMKYLNNVNHEINPTGEGKVDGEKTWNDLAEENKNTLWPEETVHLIRGNGNGGVIKAAAANYGVIAYVNLANAYGNGCFTTECKVKAHEPEATKEEIENAPEVTVKGGEKGEGFWAPLQDNGVGVKAKYADPSTSGDGATEGHSNCEENKYVNGAGAKFPPASSEDAWNEVTSLPKQKHYTLCGFTYDLSLVGFNLIAEPVRPTEEQVTLVKNYFKFMTSSEGQATITAKNSDYLGLPTNKKAKSNVLLIAQEGAAKISE